MLIVLSTKTHNENECWKKDEEWVSERRSSSWAEKKKALHKDNIILTNIIPLKNFKFGWHNALESYSKLFYGFIKCMCEHFTRLFI